MYRALLVSILYFQTPVHFLSIKPANSVRLGSRHGFAVVAALNAKAWASL